MGRTRDGHGTARPADAAGAGGQKISAANEFHSLREVFAALDTGPIVNLFTQLITLGTTIALIVCAFFVMLAGYQYMTAGGSVRAIESAKGSLYTAFIGLAIVVLCLVLANLIGGALGAPTGG